MPRMYLDSKPSVDELKDYCDNLIRLNGGKLFNSFCLTSNSAIIRRLTVLALITFTFGFSRVRILINSLDFN
jgi:hypothetical protein